MVTTLGVRGLYNKYREDLAFKYCFEAKARLSSVPKVHDLGLPLVIDLKITGVVWWCDGAG